MIPKYIWRINKYWDTFESKYGFIFLFLFVFFYFNCFPILFVSEIFKTDKKEKSQKIEGECTIESEEHKKFSETKKEKGLEVSTILPPPGTSLVKDFCELDGDEDEKIDTNNCLKIIQDSKLNAEQKKAIIELLDNKRIYEIVIPGFRLESFINYMKPDDMTIGILELLVDRCVIESGVCFFFVLHIFFFFFY